MLEPDNGGQVLRACAQSFMELHIKPAAAVTSFSFQFSDGCLPFGGLYGGYTEFKNRVSLMYGNLVNQELLQDRYFLPNASDGSNTAFQLLPCFANQIAQQANLVFNCSNPGFKKPIS